MNPAYVIAGVVFAVCVAALFTRIIYALAEENHETDAE